jgi:hypothetical protein
MNEQTLAAIRSWTSNNKGNQAVAGAANDLFYNSLSASLQRDSDASYAKTMMPLSLEYQRGQQGIATEADLRRLSAEGGIARDLREQEGRFQTDLAKINSGDVRYISDRRLDETRTTADASVKSTQIGADAQRYGADRQVDSTRIGADAQVRSTQIGADAQRYGDDTRLTGVLATNRSQEEQRRIQGDEDRKTLTQGTDESLRLRADARGAIASHGKRFFG